jgi:hypothetical protein
VFVASLFSTRANYDAAWLLLPRYGHGDDVFCTLSVRGPCQASPSKALARSDSWLVELVTGSLGRLDPHSRALSCGSEDHWSTAARLLVILEKNARLRPSTLVFPDLGNTGQESEKKRKKLKTLHFHVLYNCFTTRYEPVLAVQLYLAATTTDGNSASKRSAFGEH